MLNSEGFAAHDDPADRSPDERADLPHAKKRASGVLLRICLVALVLCVLALLYYRQYTVTGDSMEPTLLAGDRVFYVGFSKADYGDLVIFDAGETYGLVVKRVVGLSGDRIEISADGRLTRNDELIEESYLLVDRYGNSAMAAVTVESGKLFVLGDNRAISIDSRDPRIGQISERSVRGIVTRMLRNTEPTPSS